jgi:hypothetical protein
MATMDGEHRALNPRSAFGLFGLAGGDGKIVAVGQSGTVFSSTDGTVWTRQQLSNVPTLTAAAWFEGVAPQFVAVGDGGTIVTSTDGGVSWTVRQTTQPWEELSSVAAGVGLVATSASLPRVYTSSDGVTWTLQDGVVPQAMADVVWGRNEFIAVGYGGIIIASNDGIAWTTRNSPTTEFLRAVAWSGSQYVAGGLKGGILTSPDGVTWTQRPSPTTNEINAIAWSGDRFVGVINTGEVIQSTNGITWIINASVTTNRLIDITWWNGMFIAVGDFDIITSPDGSAWTDRSPHG